MLQAPYLFECFLGMAAASALMIFLALATILALSVAYMLLNGSVRLKIHAAVSHLVELPVCPITPPQYLSSGCCGRGGREIPKPTS